MDRETILTATQRLWRSTPFVWGSTDCMMSVFEYGRHITGIDGGAEWRGTYHDENGAIAVLAAAGGGLAGMRKGMGIIGAKHVQFALRGDPVCIRIDSLEIGGIFLGEMTMLRLPTEGVIELRTRHIGAWRL